jgi:hypothetical protein
MQLPFVAPFVLPQYAWNFPVLPFLTGNLFSNTKYTKGSKEKRPKIEPPFSPWCP